MPAPRIRAISISRAKPAIRLTIVSPPIVPVALWRFMRLGSAPASSVRPGVGGSRLARTVALATLLFLLSCLELGNIGSGEIDRVEQKRRKAGVGHGIGDDLPSERE